MMTLNKIETNPGFKPCGLAALAISMLGATMARGVLIASYNPDNAPTGPITTLTDQSGNGNTLTGSTTITNTNSTFNGHNYGNYPLGVTGLSAKGALYSGTTSYTVAAVYAIPTFTNTDAGGQNGFDAAGFQANIAGEIGGSNSFGIESRNDNVVGDPYLINFGPDVNSGNAPVINNLTFAVASYDGTTETLYWAYGLTGKVSSVSASFGGSAAYTFQIGVAAGDNCCGNGGSQIGKVLVYSNSEDLTAATAEISALQTYYAQTVPEPASITLLAVGGAGLAIRRRR